MAKDASFHGYLHDAEYSFGMELITLKA